MNANPVNNTLGPPRSSSPNPAGVGLLLKAFQVLDLFSDEHPSWTQAELPLATGLARSTFSRLVRFLCARGFLLEQRGRYTLGFAAVDLGRRAQSQFNLVDVCYDLLEELARTTGETVILTAYDEAHASVVCLAQIPSRQGGLRVFEHIGTAYHLYAGATAKAVLAFLPERLVDSVLRGPLMPINPAVKTSPIKLRNQLAEIRAQGFAVTYQETYPGVTGVGVPVLTPRGQPLGSIAIAGPMQRMTPKVIATAARLLLTVGRRVTERIAGEKSTPQHVAQGA
jgi:DNA-binding IclR family transcriptional regulator